MEIIDFRGTLRLPCFLGSPRVTQKPIRPIHSAKNIEGDFGKFTDFMRALVRVPHDEIKARLDAEKREKQQKKASSRASRENG